MYIIYIQNIYKGNIMKQLKLDDFLKLYDGFGDIYINQKYERYLKLLSQGISPLLGFFDNETIKRIKNER